MYALDFCASTLMSDAYQGLEWSHANIAVFTFFSYLPIYKTFYNCHAMINKELERWTIMPYVVFV